MGQKKSFNPDEIDENIGPMNSVSKEDAEVWAHQKAGVDYDEKQLKRISEAKKKKAKVSSKKQDRRFRKQILKNLDE